MKPFTLLAPTALSKPRLKPFRVTVFDRSVKKGIMAENLQDLITKAMDSLQVSCVSALLLEEDGTGVDTEDFFQTLPNNAALMLLDKGQKWTPLQNSPSKLQNDRNLQHRKDVARLTLDLYKTNPNDFIGCVNVKATLYGVYSVSYNMRCYAAKRMMKEVLRWTLFSMQATGHILLGSSCYIEQMLDEEEERAVKGLTVKGLTEKGLAEKALAEKALAGKALVLPQINRIRQLQSVLLGRTGL